MLTPSVRTALIRSMSKDLFTSDDCQGYYSSMIVASRLAALREEVDAIHHANRLYWAQKKPSRTARAEYEWRQERLERIRREMQELEEN